jgi:hypothetical protein
MATTTPNFGWPVPTSTDLVKDGATAIEALGDGIDTSLVDLKGGTTGQVLAKATSADMDFAWVAQDDSNAIQNAIVDAKGDLIAASANDTPARLAAGANGLSLVTDSAETTGLKWGYANAVGCAIYNSNGVGTTVANNTNTALSWDSEVWDSNAFHSTATNTSRITIPTGLGGTYQFNASLLWQNSAVGTRYIGIRKNGGGTVFFGGINAGVATSNPASTVTRILTAAAADYFEIMCFQNSGGNLDAYNDEIRNAWFEAIYLGA